MTLDLLVMKTMTNLSHCLANKPNRCDKRNKSMEMILDILSSQLRFHQKNK